jgi:hypothetical protein
MPRPSVNRAVAHHNPIGAPVRLYTLPAGLFMLAVAASPNVEKADCANIASRHTAAIAKVTDALHAYKKCIAGGEKDKDCADEMQALDDAHDDFADVVADGKTCQ